MKAILEKLYTNDKETLAQDILHSYQYNHSVIVNFLYFTQIVAHQVFEKESQKSNIQKKYKKALLKADYLLPDGIALQIFYWLSSLLKKITTKNKKLHNLNGTDFVPYFLDYIKKKNGPQAVCLGLYGAPEPYLKKAAEYLSVQGYNIVYTQHGYSEFIWEDFQEAIKDYQDTINILLVARSTVTNPIQELRSIKHANKIKNNKLLVINTGGLFDFFAGAQKRAPLWIRKIRLERLYRFITDPKRNYKKVKYSLALFSYIFRHLLLKK